MSIESDPIRGLPEEAHSTPTERDMNQISLTGGSSPLEGTPEFYAWNLYRNVFGQEWVAKDAYEARISECEGMVNVLNGVKNFQITDDPIKDMCRYLDLLGRNGDNWAAGQCIALSNNSVDLREVFRQALAAANDTMEKKMYDPTFPASAFAAEVVAPVELDLLRRLQAVAFKDET